MLVNVLLRVGRILYIMSIQMLILSALNLLFMLLSGMVQSVFFVDKFFATLITFHNWVVMNMPCMAN